MEVASVDLGGRAAGSVDGVGQVPDGGDELRSGRGSGQEKGKDGEDLHVWVCSSLLGVSNSRFLFGE